MSKNDDRLQRLLLLVEKGYIRFAQSYYNEAGTGIVFSITYPNHAARTLTGAQVDALLIGVYLVENHNRTVAPTDVGK